MQFEILGELSDDDRDRLLAASVRRRYRARTLVFTQGDMADGVHLVERGRLAIEVGSESGDIYALDIMGPGEVLGEQALVSDDRRTGTARALEPTETLFLRAEAFDELRRAHPSVDRFLVRVLADRVNRLTQQVLAAAYLPAEDRICRQLIMLSEVYRERPGQPVVLPVTQDQLATLSGTTRPTVNRVLKRLRESGALELARGRIRVRRPEALGSASAVELGAGGASGVAPGLASGGSS